MGRRQNKLGTLTPRLHAGQSRTSYVDDLGALRMGKLTGGLLVHLTFLGQDGSFDFDFNTCCNVTFFKTIAEFRQTSSAPRAPQLTCPRCKLPNRRQCLRATCCGTNTLPHMSRDQAAHLRPPLCGPLLKAAGRTHALPVFRPRV